MAKPDWEAIESASVVLSHRVDLAGWRQIANHLKTFLARTVITEDNHAALVRTLSAGVDAQLKLIKGERDAYGLNNETAPGAEKELAQWMKDLAEDDAHGIQFDAENTVIAEQHNNNDIIYSENKVSMSQLRSFFLLLA
ncbi:hypothetical protein SK355_10110 [Candidatus Fukatsuia symbiotica]|uniref:hypothetical protein n=1 Tax=Candidatus Fukatsuia TaxID=1927833 RepID=UPI0019675CE4|nr:hypothetical protein [Candidatus Fukatsuia symbiotica]MEA9445551.1 hypothetical protein [Candidatus Fukatsuia symbiotica]